MADDFTWTLTGTTEWSGVYRGKEAVQRDLFRPLFAQFAERYTNRPVRMIAEGDWVVVECCGRTVTKAGKPYENTYCWVIRVEDGRLAELTEYLDTELVADALGPPV